MDNIGHGHRPAQPVSQDPALFQLAGHTQTGTGAIHADPTVDRGASGALDTTSTGEGQCSGHALHSDTPKTLDDHCTERGEFVRQLLYAAGIHPTHGPNDGPYRWERPAPADPDIPPRPVLLLHAIAERQRWKAEYTAAQLAASGSPPGKDCSATRDQAA
jgi:hypothetical protein